MKVIYDTQFIRIEWSKWPGTHSEWTDRNAEWESGSYERPGGQYPETVSVYKSTELKDSCCVLTVTLARYRRHTNNFIHIGSLLRETSVNRQEEKRKHALAVTLSKVVRVYLTWEETQQRCIEDEASMLWALTRKPLSIHVLGSAAEEPTRFQQWTWSKETSEHQPSFSNIDHWFRHDQSTGTWRRR